MRKHFAIAGFIAGAVLTIATAPARAAHVDVGVNIGIPGVVAVAPAPAYYVDEPQPAYIAPEHEREWRERHLRAHQWQERQEHREQNDRA